MPKPTTAKKATQSRKSASPLMVRLDEETKACLVQAAELRKVSVSDYVRAVTLPQARREVAAAKQHTIILTPDEYQRFWEALQEPVQLSPAQKKLGAIMRGEG